MLAAVARNAAEPVVIAGTDRRIVFLNAAAEALFGAAADLRGRDVTELTAPAERERARTLTRRMLVGGALVLAAMYLVELRSTPRDPEATAAEDPPVEALHHDV